MPIARVNGVALYYESTGAGRPPLVLVHGFACGIRSWDLQVPTLSRRRRVVAYDVRGHGISEAPPEASAYSLHDFMARTIPGARSVVPPGLGHLTPLEAPDRFNRLVSRFLAPLKR
jgi:pimeloyl-ACP methyl ester carboxylesterase